MKIVTALLALLGVLLTIGCEQKPSMTPVQRGEYIVNTHGCDHCHTPLKMGAFGPEPDMTRRLSGHPQDFVLPPAPAPAGPWIWHGAATNTAFAGPWGISFATNLTPDTLTGMGIWTEDMFIKAIRTGKHMATSRPIMPPMPWDSYGKMTDDDLKALYAYLRSLAPFSNQAPDYQAPPEQPMEGEKLGG
jgi:hypothetical protein